MRAVVWQRPGQLKVTEVPDPAPGHGELVIQVGACGICGTDVHIADGDFPPTPYPIIPGHEFSGRVMALGHSVPGGWREGERVAVDPSLFRVPRVRCSVLVRGLCGARGSCGA